MKVVTHLTSHSSNLIPKLGHSVAGSWAYPNRHDPHSDSRLSICVTRHEGVTDEPDTDAYSIGHVPGNTETGTFHASYGVGQAYRGMGCVDNIVMCGHEYVWL